MKWKRISAYVYSIIIAVGVGVLASFITKDSMAVYETVPKSSLTPPSYLFPVVWTALFILMGISAARIFRSNDPLKNKALILYGVQLAVNFFWSILFFNLRAYFFAFLWLILLWLLIVCMIWKFYQIRPWAGLLQIPYLLWVTFAGYLNFMIWFLNR